MSTLPYSNIYDLKHEQATLLKVIEDASFKLYPNDETRNAIIIELHEIINKHYTLLSIEFILSTYNFDPVECRNEDSFGITYEAINHFLRNGYFLSNAINMFDWFICKSELSYFINKLNEPNLTADKLNIIVDKFKSSLIKNCSIDNGLSVETVNDVYLKSLDLFNAMDYNDEYLNTMHWKDFRSKARKHFGQKCQMCSSTMNLQVHHNNYQCIGKETFSDVTLLCDKCHKKTHGKP